MLSGGAQIATDMFYQIKYILSSNFKEEVMEKKELLSILYKVLWQPKSLNQKEEEFNAKKLKDLEELVDDEIRVSDREERRLKMPLFFVR
jgi:hypothetical protein